ncbi:unnamed protein product, partial [Brassica rapa subsp. trilocularis]
ASTKGRKLVRRLAYLCFQAKLYALWVERNSHLHRNTFRSIDNITQRVERQIKNRISSYRDSNPVTSSNLMALWFATEPTR